MSNGSTRPKRRPEHLEASPAMLIDVQIQQSREDCPIYTWERERGSLRLTGVYRAQAGLPADLAICQLEGHLELPVLLLSIFSSPPGTLVQTRVLGALGYPPSRDAEECLLPTDGWVFVAVAEGEASPPEMQSITRLPLAHITALKAYVHTTLQQQLQQTPGEVACRDAETAARMIRETRLQLKREQRAQPRRKGWLKREEEEKPVAWRALEGLSEALHEQLLKDAPLQGDGNAPYAQAERLIRFVPQRFQQALADLLLDDERLLAFVERPLLRHQTGWLGMQTWRSNEGLFLVTDRQALWLRDFLAPGSNFLPGGYIAHIAPLERLQGIVHLPAGRVASEFADRVEPKVSPYQRLVMEVASGTGSEPFAIEFPNSAQIAKALAQVTDMLRACLPSPSGTEDRRIRRLPIVEAWSPRGAEAEQLALLGGTVPPVTARRFEQRLTDLVHEHEEELLVEATIPSLEGFKSPARLVALTRRALLVLEEGRGTPRCLRGVPAEQAEHVHRYELATITSAQLRHSLLGSSLSIFVPRPDGHTQQHVFPFHSPAIARFLPLFTRLRILLGAPFCMS